MPSTWLLGPTPDRFFTPMLIVNLLVYGWPTFCSMIPIGALFTLFATIALLHADLVDSYVHFLQSSGLLSDRADAAHSLLVDAQSLSVAIHAFERLQSRLRNLESSFQFVLLPCVAIALGSVLAMLLFLRRVFDYIPSLIVIAGGQLIMLTFVLGFPAVVTWRCQEVVMWVNKAEARLRAKDTAVESFVFDLPQTAPGEQKHVTAGHAARVTGAEHPENLTRFLQYLTVSNAGFCLLGVNVTPNLVKTLVSAYVSALLLVNQVSSRT